MLTRNERLILECDRLGSELEGICSADGMAVFVPGALPGETVDVLIVKPQPKYAFGKLMGIQNASPSRQEPFCPIYDKCGGCSGQHMNYEATLAAKRMQVLDCLTRIGGLTLTEEDVPLPLGSEKQLHFRNKTALPVSGTSAQPQIGFYRKRSHDIIPAEDCPVTMGPLKGVLSAVREWITRAGVAPWQETTGKGLLRHVVVRTTRRGETMVTLVAAKPNLPKTELLTELLQARADGFCSLHISVNPARNNVILGNSSRKLWGQDSVTETLLGLDFEILPLSFFQVNPEQTERLYRTAIDFAALAPDDVVVDAYAGAGTISLCMARQCRKVIGIEIVPQAVEGAHRNAALNRIENAEFHTAAVEDLLPRLVREGLRPDVVVLDPPRKGCEPEVLNAVITAAPRRVVYVSCHVPTQARDVKLLCEAGYRLERCQPVDMFCWAGGVENVVSLIRKDI